MRFMRMLVGMGGRLPVPDAEPLREFGTSGLLAATLKAYGPRIEDLIWSFPTYGNGLIGPPRPYIPPTRWTVTKRRWRRKWRLFKSVRLVVTETMHDDCYR